MTDLIYTALRLFDCLGAVVAGALFWRDTRRRTASGLIDEATFHLRLGFLGYLVGSGLLFGRAYLQEAPGGPHLALIAIPLLWILRPLVASEIAAWKHRHRK